MLKHCNLGKLKKNLELSRALAENGLLSALPVQTEKGEDFLREGEVYFYLTRRLPGKQMVSHSMEAKDGRFVGEILGRLHLALRNIDDCVSEADLMATLQDWALPRAKTAMDLSEQFCREYLDAFAALYPSLPRQIIHRDPNPGNILRADNQWGFVDFELAERNARIYDPCYAATAVLSESFPDRKEDSTGRLSADTTAWRSLRQKSVTQFPIYCWPTSLSAWLGLRSRINMRSFLKPTGK